MIKLIAKWWRRKMRAADRTLLFPSFDSVAEDEDHLIGLKIQHIMFDSSWRFPDEWKDEEPEIYNILTSDEDD